ncbi:MAG TPA: O-antigen ligase family protein [Bryobacterales bacterium]|nr:O-antigen ligase family protein [Bryobacterales bacterium]
MTRVETFGRLSLWLSASGGVAAGLAIVWLAEMPVRWVTAVLLGAGIVAAALMTGQPRRAALFLTAFSLQIGLVLYLTKPEPASDLGASWPNSLALPLGTLAALGALLCGVRRRFTWGGTAGLCAGIVAFTTAASLPGSPRPFIGVCHVVLVFAYYAIFLAAANCVRELRDLRLINHALMISLALQSLVYFAQSLVGATFTPAGEWIEQTGQPLGRYGGWAGTQPAAFASFLLPLLLLAVARFLTARDLARLHPAMLLTVMGLSTLCLTFTRAAWIGLGLAVIYLVGAAARRAMLVRRNALLLAVCLVAVAGALGPGISVRVRQDHASALAERWSLIRMGLQVARAKPLAGVGAGAYPYVFENYLTPDLAKGWLYVVHNVYVLRAAETGLPGLAALVFLLGAFFRLASPERMQEAEARVMALGWRAGLIALSWEMLWDVSLGPAANSLLWFLSGLMISAARFSPQRP